MKKNSEIIKFKADEPITLVLDTEPSTAKSRTTDSQWGTKTNYTIFCDNNRVMFASQALFDKLRAFNKGDKVTINLADGKFWSVTKGETVAKPVSNIQNVLDNTETMILLRKIAMDMDVIKSYIIPNSKTDSTQPSIVTEEELIDF